MIPRSNKEPAIVLRNRAERYMVRVFALEDDHNGDPDDFDGQRNLKDHGRKSSVIFWYYQ
jgi:hypothetical protein